MSTAVHTHIHMQDTLRLALSKPNTVRHVHTQNVANKLAGHTRPLYQRYKHGTHCAMVQPQYEYEHGLADSLYKRKNTVHTVRRYKYSTSASAGK